MSVTLPRDLAFELQKSCVLSRQEPQILRGQYHFLSYKPNGLYSLLPFTGSRIGFKSLSNFTFVMRSFNFFTLLSLLSAQATFAEPQSVPAKSGRQPARAKPASQSSTRPPPAEPLVANPAPAEPLAQRSCKAVPGGSNWPTNEQWGALNTAVRGRLSKPPPPAAACHRNQPGYNAARCAAVEAGWKDANWHVDHPTSNMWQNYNNYSCMPDALSPCSSAGYPIYVVTAREASDVKAAVDFARTFNVRLNIKSTG
jgi:hypothetical protein